jgi:uncharacterized protein YbaR (Trm112 family)
MNLQPLIDVLLEARVLLANPENNFLWSSWEDSSDALEEIDGLLGQLKVGELPSADSLNVLFLPTGPIQEVSLSSGWGHEFLELANRFDAAMVGCFKTCECQTNPARDLVNIHELGLNERYGQVTILACPTCGQFWLKYFAENEGFTASGCWYLGAITPEQGSNLTLENAVLTLEKLDWYFVGGSYFGGQVSKGLGKIFLPDY